MLVDKPFQRKRKLPQAAKAVKAVTLLQKVEEAATGSDTDMLVDKPFQKKCKLSQAAQQAKVGGAATGSDTDLSEHDSDTEQSNKLAMVLWEDSSTVPPTLEELEALHLAALAERREANGYVIEKKRILEKTPQSEAYKAAQQFSKKAKRRCQDIKEMIAQRKAEEHVPKPADEEQQQQVSTMAMQDAHVAAFEDKKDQKKAKQRAEKRAAKAAKDAETLLRCTNTPNTDTDAQPPSGYTYLDKTMRLSCLIIFYNYK